MYNLRILFIRWIHIFGLINLPCDNTGVLSVEKHSKVILKICLPRVVENSMPCVLLFSCKLLFKARHFVGLFTNPCGLSCVQQHIQQRVQCCPRNSLKMHEKSKRRPSSQGKINFHFMTFGGENCKNKWNTLCRICIPK